MVQALQRSKGIEKAKVRGQVVDKIDESLGSHGGDRGSKPLGTATVWSWRIRMLYLVGGILIFLFWAFGVQIVSIIFNLSQIAFC
jgi:hypothetical protein